MSSEENIDFKGFWEALETEISSDSRALEEEKAYSQSGSDYKEETLQSLSDAFGSRYRDNSILRRTLAKWAAWLVSLYLLSVILILIFNEILGICLSDNVLDLLLKTTTANVLGIIFIAMRDLFNGKSEEYMHHMSH